MGEQLGQGAALGQMYPGRNSLAPCGQFKDANQAAMCPTPVLFPTNSGLLPSVSDILHMQKHKGHLSIHLDGSQMHTHTSPHIHTCTYIQATGTWKVDSVHQMIIESNIHFVPGPLPDTESFGLVFKKSSKKTW